MKTKILAVCIILILSLRAHSQSSIGYSVGVKTGFESFKGIYLEGVDLNFNTTRFIYSIGYNYAKELELLSLFITPREHYQQVNVLFGSFISKESFRFEYQGGLGVLWGTRRTSYDASSSSLIVNGFNTKPFSTPCLSLKGSIKYIPFRFMSIGLDVLVNINPVKSFARPMITLNFGKMKNNSL